MIVLYCTLFIIIKNIIYLLLKEIFNFVFMYHTEKILLSLNVEAFFFQKLCLLAYLILRVFNVNFGFELNDIHIYLMHKTLTLNYFDLMKTLHDF